MPRRKHKKGGKVSTHDAPTMQGMQQVNSWDLVDIIPINTGQPTQTSPFTWQAGCGPNGWYYSVTQGNTSINDEAALYGASTGQFEELAQLWSTYRINWVEMIYYPNMTGSGATGPTISAVDPAGVIGPVTSATEVQSAFSRLKSTSITMPYQKCKRRINYSNWIIQTCPQPYLATVEDGGTGRVRYPETASDNPVVPSIRMVAQNLPEVGRLTLGVLHVRCNITVRGRRGVQLSQQLSVRAVSYLEHPRNKSEEQAAKNQIVQDPQAVRPRSALPIECHEALMKMISQEAK